MIDNYASIDGSMVGVFHKSRAGDITFEYDGAHGASPISLSLPRHGKHAPGAALAYLDNLLPDHQDARDKWARDREPSGSDPFPLLAAYGEDGAGAVSLSSDPNLPTRGDETLFEAVEDDIAERIASLRHVNSNWTDPRVKPRVSLAGMQGKFTLTKVENR